MRAIAADDEGSSELGRLALTVQDDAYTILLLLRRNEGGVVLDTSALTPQLFDE